MNSNHMDNFMSKHDLVHVDTVINYEKNERFQNFNVIYFDVVFRGKDGRLWQHNGSCHRLDLQLYSEDNDV